MYNTWASNFRFQVGDSIIFEYKNDSMIREEKRGYYHCNESSHDSEFKDGLQEKIKAAILNSEGLFYGSTTQAIQPLPSDLEVDTRLLKMGEKIGCGSCGNLYRESYLGQDVAIKILQSEHLNETVRVEFAQELMILREVQHKNVVRFIGACTNPPQFCIVTEYMHGGSLYDYLHKQKNITVLSLLLKFSLDVCEGMDYLHQKNIIHRDLKIVNLLMDNNQIHESFTSAKP